MYDGCSSVSVSQLITGARLGSIIAITVSNDTSDPKNPLLRGYHSTPLALSILRGDFDSVNTTCVTLWLADS
ncbi:hypothetical protein VTL71DRAFT_8218 [Oculimacula yallundae]|uniref:Uncharacterized protein n=1 Tax=Oculimacula yallundae TaxID=86028 RepID=A0ABR4CX00_9HELO